jgi:hypothetical protein
MRYSCNLLQTVGRVPGKRSRSSARTGSKRPLLPARQPASQPAPSSLPACSPARTPTRPRPAAPLRPPRNCSLICHLLPRGRHACSLLHANCFRSVAFPIRALARRPNARLTSTTCIGQSMGGEAGGAGAFGQPAQHHAMSAEPGNYT